MTPWKRYVDDTIATIKLTSIDYVLRILNTFHKDINFTYELEINNKSSFSDVILIRKNDTLETTIYRKSTNNRVYLHWDSFPPKNWKRSTLRSILTRAYKICSTKESLDEELRRIKREFIEINGYPKWIVNEFKEECKLLNEQYDRNIQTDIDSNTVGTTTLCLFFLIKVKKEKNWSNHYTSMSKKFYLKTVSHGMLTKVKYWDLSSKSKTNKIRTQ